MDPVYAGAIAGMALLFGGCIIGFVVYVYKEWRSRTTVYTRV